MPEEKEVNLLKVENVVPEQEPNLEVQETNSVIETKETDPDNAENQETTVTSVKATAVASVPSVASQKDPILVDLENLLSEDLTDMYLGLSDDKKIVFREKGEEVAGFIQQMIQVGKVKTRKVFDLIKEWLQLIPGVNKFFLEQEAKIKSDKIIRYANEQIKSSKNNL